MASYKVVMKAVWEETYYVYGAESEEEAKKAVESGEVEMHVGQQSGDYELVSLTEV